MPLLHNGEYRNLPSGGEVLLDETMTLRDRLFSGRQIEAWQRFSEIIPTETSPSQSGLRTVPLSEPRGCHRHSLLIENYGPRWNGTLSQCGDAWIACLAEPVVLDEARAFAYRDSFIACERAMLSTHPLASRATLAPHSMSLFSLTPDSRANYLAGFGINYIVIASSHDDAEALDTLFVLAGHKSAYHWPAGRP